MTTPKTTTTPEATQSKATEQRIERLSTASLKRILEPDVDVPGAVGDGQVLPDELLSLFHVPELFAGLTEEQKAVLSREEFASIADTGVRFESVLMAGFSMEILNRSDLADPRVTYLLHEMGEETRDSGSSSGCWRRCSRGRRTRSTTLSYGSPNRWCCRS